MKNIKKNSELICEFLNAHKSSYPEGDVAAYELYGVLEFIEDGEFEQHFFSVGEMKFHSSWDWLMPVISKLEQMEDSYEYEEFLRVRDEVVTGNINTTYPEVVKCVEYQKFNKALTQK